jgi:hypothetical protein
MSTAGTPPTTRTRRDSLALNRRVPFVEAVGIEPVSIHPVQTILERFRGQVSPKTPSNNTNKTR